MISCWIVTEGLKGTENQCLGIADALGLRPEIKQIGLRQPWKFLSPYIGFENRKTFTGDPLTEPWPDLAITSGRKAIAAARYIKKASDGKTFIVQVQDPRGNYRDFDLIAVPRHDPARGENIVVTNGAPNRVTAQSLADGRTQFKDKLSALPEPRVAVLIGGNSKAYKMTAQNMEKIVGQLKELASQGYGLMITASRRTGEDNHARLRDEMKGENIYFWDGDGPNPYFGFLGWANYIVVTPDSVSMVSEAATTGKPVYLLDMQGGNKRFASFHENLLNRGITRLFEGQLIHYDYMPLNDAAHVATEIRQYLDIKAI